MDKTKNIFVSHYHTDADSILKLKSLLDRHGLKMKDSSIYESKNPNNANNEEYIKSLIRPRIDWAGTTVVLIGKNTSKLSQFSFVDETILADDLEEGFNVDHAFECAGGEGREKELLECICKAKVIVKFQKR